jgi:hypothetical protein
MDINIINYRKFPKTCNAYSKKDHKEADYYFKITYRFYSKKGYNEAYCYTKKNKKKSKTIKDMV